MLAAIKGYYDGTQIIVKEKDRQNLKVGDEVVITILENAGRHRAEDQAQRRLRYIENGAITACGKRKAEEIDAYLKELKEILEKLWEM